MRNVPFGCKVKEKPWIFFYTLLLINKMQLNECIESKNPAKTIAFSYLHFSTHENSFNSQNPHFYESFDIHLIFIDFKVNKKLV